MFVNATQSPATKVCSGKQNLTCGHLVPKPLQQRQPWADGVGSQFDGQTSYSTLGELRRVGLYSIGKRKDNIAVECLTDGDNLNWFLVAVVSSVEYVCHRLLGSLLNQAQRDCTNLMRPEFEQEAHSAYPFAFHDPIFAVCPWQRGRSCSVESAKCLIKRP